MCAVRLTGPPGAAAMATSASGPPTTATARPGSTSTTGAGGPSNTEPRDPTVPKSSSPARTRA